MDEKRLKNLVFGENIARFNLFKDMLIAKNAQFNLTSVLTDEGIFNKHFVDSVAGEEYFFDGASVVEIGSGGGFPSVPLKIVRPDLKFTLIESTGKKCVFLREVISALCLLNMEVKNMRAEDGAKTDMRESFDICCARAVAPLNALSEYCLPYVKIGGRFIAYKGDADEEIKAAANAIKILGGEIEKTDKFELEGCGKRTLVIVKKVRPTPLKYPRGNGKERKNPL